MEILLEQSERLIRHVDLSYKRYLFSLIDWEKYRLIGVKGARGLGKTTLLLQWLKMQNLPANQAAYFSLDDLYFTLHSVKETVDTFYKNGGKILILDEVHKYKNWSIEIKNCYDFFPDLKIIFTGSSVIDISRQEGDLSRRAVMYELTGLSFREYMELRGIMSLPKLNLGDVLFNSKNFIQEIPVNFRPLVSFKAYLNYGFYPFISEPSVAAHQQINQLVRTIVEVDMAELKDFDIRNAKKLLQLIYLIAQMVPFKPNISSLAEKSGIHRNTLNSYLHYLEQAKIINMLFPSGNSLVNLQKPEKIYLNNTTLMAALSENKQNIGALRETFFFSQMRHLFKVNFTSKGDFIIDDTYTFEIGVISKTARQIDGVENAWVVKDDIEWPINKNIPLWMFGLLY